MTCHDLFLLSSLWLAEGFGDEVYAGRFGGLMVRIHFAVLSLGGIWYGNGYGHGMGMIWKDGNKQLRGQMTR
ncbi:hypothetical protein VTJ04DRAFT_8137 [Mycothermus thermophilus]|uniref:uncharacterized protein n=1 Tax=Humicola insolens TaxID=85995 RepID=UPI003743771B